MSKFFGKRNPKITLRRNKNEPALRYFRFQVCSTFDWTGAKKYMWPDRSLKQFFFFFYQDINL